MSEFVDVQDERIAWYAAGLDHGIAMGHRQAADLREAAAARRPVPAGFTVHAPSHYGTTTMCGRPLDELCAPLPNVSHQLVLCEACRLIAELTEAARRG